MFLSELLAARLQMALSLGFHIIFACIGMVMPFLMAFSHYRWLRTKNPTYLALTKAWSKGVAIFFAVGAVSGTLLSFELSLLWPEFMKHAGPIFGMPFSLEGAAFFVEAIALGLFLYGWGKVPSWLHWSFGVLVGISGLMSGILVVAANGWMNSPTGFDYVDGKYINIDPVAAMFNDAWFHQALHMSLAAFVSTGFAVAGLHAFLLLRGKNKEFHKAAFSIALGFGALFSVLQILSGDLLAKDVATRQPLKLAAMESHFYTEKGADLIVGGIPDVENQTVNYALELPNMLSFLAFGDFSAEVKGLEEFPKDLWPPVTIVHFAFQIMVACGSLLALVGITYGILLFRGTTPSEMPWFLKVCVLVTPLGFIAVEAGWIVTEVGRQPWIIYGHMKTADALTQVPGMQFSLLIYCIMYAFLSLVVVWLLKRQIQSVPKYLSEAR